MSQKKKLCIFVSVRTLSSFHCKLYKYFPPNLTHVTALPCGTQMFSIVT